LADFLQSSTAVLFDLDGTLYDLNVDWGAIKVFMQQHLRETYGDDFKSIRFFQFFQYVEAKYGSKAVDFYLNHIEAEELKNMKKHTYQKRWLAGEGLQWIKQKISNQSIIGIISSNFHGTIEEILQNNSELGLYNLLIGRDDVKHPKPDPEGINKVVDKYSLDKSKVLYVGDNWVDEDAAKQAGVYFLYEDELKRLILNT
jgi:phosphoglycolate phosphatase